MSETWSGRRVLVTGGLGFIGSNLVMELVQLGARVAVIDCPDGRYGGSAGNLGHLIDQVQIYDVDLLDADGLHQHAADSDVIFCLAGQVSHPNSMQDPLTDLDINCRVQLQLLEACRHWAPQTKLVFTSSRQVYGRPQTHPVDEDHPVHPVDVNGISKMAAEQFFRLYWDVYGIRSVCLRLTNTYGPRMDLTSAGRGFTNVCLSRVLRGDVVTLFGTGEQRRDFMYVDDVVEALILAADQESGFGLAYNLSHPCPCSLQDFVRTLQNFVNVQVQFIPFPPDRLSIDVGDYTGCSRRFQNLTGWKAKTSLEDGLRATIDYFQTMHCSADAETLRS